MQRRSSGVAAFTAAVLAVTAYFVAPWEGERQDVYADVAGIPTVCYGHTGDDVRHGQPARTDEQCAMLLRQDVASAYSAVQQCITAPLTVTQASAFTSLAYNAGRRSVCGSTLQRAANTGDILRACQEIRRWVYAGGRRVQGLVNRREAEYKLCTEGLK